MTVTEKMIRKQFLMSPSTAKRLERIAAERGTSASEIVRRAIDSFDSQAADAMDATDLMSLVSERLKEAIKATRKANRTVNRSLKRLTESAA